jgi:hypothetical protein
MENALRFPYLAKTVSRVPEKSEVAISLLMCGFLLFSVIVRQHT